MARMGRPPIEIDWEQFEKLCQILCTLEEIAGFFKCSVDTIENKCRERFGQTFSEVYKEKSAAGKISLRRKQYQLAMEGDKTMLVWLGKQALGQVDNLEHRLKKEEDAVRELSDRELFERAKLVLPLIKPEAESEDQG